MNFLHVVIVIVLAGVPTVSASEWDKLLTDIELFEQLMEEDETDMTNEQYDAQLDDSADLFPVAPGEQSNTEDDFSLSETHVTIKVDGVPVVLNDVAKNQWFASFVRDAAGMGLVSGYKDTLGRPSGLYGPADAVTVEQIAKMAVIARGIDTYMCGEELKSTTAVGRWSEIYVRCAESNSWAVFSDGSVDAPSPATRAEVVVTILQAFGARVSPVSGTVFSDVGRSTVYGNAIETAAAMGIVSGYSDENGNPTGMFGPEDNVNRAEAAKMFSIAAGIFGG